MIPNHTNFLVTKVTQGDGESDYYTYDKKGFLISVVEGTLLQLQYGRTLYQYSHDGHLIQKRHLAKSVDVQLIDFYDQRGNISSTVSEFRYERYEYIYDSNNNWLSRKKISGTPGKDDKLIQYDIRKITYFEQAVPETIFPIPDQQFMEAIYQQAIVFASICQQNHDKLVAYYKAIE